MKTENMYLNRLLKLAKHLGKNHLNEVLYNKAKNYTGERAGCNIEHFSWALAQLPKIESQRWKYDKDGHPYLTSSSQLNALTSAGIFFNLTADELFHLFVPGYQDPNLNGIPLGENATPSDFANNVYQFVSFKEADCQEHEISFHIRNMKEKKVIKKYKLKNAA